MTEETAAEEAETAEHAQITADFPGWHVWRSQAGRWWATRVGQVSWDQHDHNPDFAMTIDADDPEDLVKQLIFHDEQC